MMLSFAYPTFFVPVVLFLLHLILFSSANGDSTSKSVQNVNKTIVFVAGWPQSGTSMIHKLLSVHPLMATMMEKCQEKHGNRCENWNYEGQWLLGNATLRQTLHSGATCPVRSLSKDIQENIFNEWYPLWPSSLPFLIEKSPQSLVKTLALRDMFVSRGFSVKFLIIIKHPVTINTMTPRKYSWRYEREVVGSTLASFGKNSRTPSEIAEKMITKDISMQQMQENLRFFLKILTHRSIGSDCSLGWIDAYEELLDVLERSPAVFSRESFRIVHYESFVKPMTQCSRIFEFLFSEYLKDPLKQESVQAEYKQFCSSVFAQTAEATTPLQTHTQQITNNNKHHTKTNSHKHGRTAGTGSKKKSPRRRLTHSDSVMNEDHRSLRLRTNNNKNKNKQNNKNDAPTSQPFQFHASLVKQESMKRLREFFFVTSTLANLDDDFDHARNKTASDVIMKNEVHQLLSQLEALAPRLLALGYQLHSPMPVAAKSNNNEYKWAKWVL